MIHHGWRIPGAMVLLETLESKSRDAESTTGLGILAFTTCSSLGVLIALNNMVNVSNEAMLDTATGDIFLALGIKFTSVLYGFFHSNFKNALKSLLFLDTVLMAVVLLATSIYVVPISKELFLADQWTTVLHATSMLLGQVFYGLCSLIMTSMAIDLYLLCFMRDNGEQSIIKRKSKGFRTPVLSRKSVLNTVNVVSKVDSRASTKVSKVETIKPVSKVETIKPVSKVETIKPVSKVERESISKIEINPISKVERESISKIEKKPISKVERGSISKIEIKPISKVERESISSVESKQIQTAGPVLKVISTVVSQPVKRNEKIVEQPEILDSGEQNDLIMGGILCFTGMILSAVISRKLAR